MASKSPPPGFNQTQPPGATSSPFKVPSPPAVPTTTEPGAAAVDSGGMGRRALAKQDSLQLSLEADLLSLERTPTGSFSGDAPNLSPKVKPQESGFVHGGL